VDSYTGEIYCSVAITKAFKCTNDYEVSCPKEETAKVQNNNCLITAGIMFPNVSGSNMVEESYTFM
jgi:hypothetical protein